MNYLIDIDGTLLSGPDAIPGAVDFINRLNQNNEKYLLMTNSIKSLETQKERLANVRIQVDINRILNPIAAINKYLIDNGIKRVKIVGSEAEINQVRAVNVKDNYEIVILLDFEKSNSGYDEIQKLVKDAENGIKLITASVSTYYLKNGKKAVDTGAFVKLIEEITNEKIENYGKPSIKYFTIAEQILNSSKNEIYVIGDDWNTDIIGANEFGAKSILVRSGKYKPQDEMKCNPNKIINSLNEI